MALHDGEVICGVKAKYTKCKTCANAHGPKPWADKAEKAYCLAYTRASGFQKPSDVYFDGADCPFYAKEEA